MHAFQLLAQSSPNVGGAAAFGAIWLVFLALALIASVFWIWMLVDCLTSSLPSSEKLVWAIVIIFLHLLGAILYFAIARGGARRTT